MFLQQWHEGHGNISESAAIVTGAFPRCLDGQEPSLGQRDIANGLTLGGEVKLFFFLALIFSHAGIIGDGDGVGSNGSINAVLK